MNYNAGWAWRGPHTLSHTLIYTCLLFPHPLPLGSLFGSCTAFSVGTDGLQNVILCVRTGCKILFTREVIFGDLIGLSFIHVLQVPWPPRSMAESWKRRPQWGKWSSKTLQGAVRPTDQPAGRGDAHGHVFPTRGPCRSRARWVNSSQGWKDACYDLFGKKYHQTCNKTVHVTHLKPHILHGFSWNAYLCFISPSDKPSVQLSVRVRATRKREISTSRKN